MRAILFNLGIAAAIGIAAVAAVTAVVVYRKDRSKTVMERHSEEARLAAKKSQSPPLKKRIQETTAGSLGWGLALEPYIWFLLFVYLSFTAVLAAFGIGTTVTAIMSFPLSLIAAYAVATITNAKRQEQFQASLIGALDSFSAGLQQGSTKAEALSMLVPNLPEPLKTELDNAVSRHTAGANLAESVAEIHTRYPSKALRMLVTCLHVEDGSISSAVEHIAESIRNDVRVRKEAATKITKDIREYYITSAISLMIALFILSQIGLDNMLTPSILSIVIWGGVANFVFGFLRVRKLASAVRKL